MVPVHLPSSQCVDIPVLNGSFESCEKNGNEGNVSIVSGYLFQPVVGRFFRDDHIMHVAFAQPCR